MVITISKSPNADSRTASKNHVSFEEFSRSTDMHRDDVKRMMDELARMVAEAGEHHDWTKKEKEVEFFKQFTDAKEKGTSFKDSDWYKYHSTTERHHLNSHVPEDVNLIDVLEMISDCVCAGMARSGKLHDIELDEKVLKKAFDNTVELVKSKIHLDD